MTQGRKLALGGLVLTAWFGAASSPTLASLPTGIILAKKPPTPPGGSQLPSGTAPGGSLARPPRPAPPGSQRPNNTTAGGSLSASCPTTQQPLRALIPKANPVTTTQASPAIWIYLPYGATEVQGAEFAINAGLDEKKRVYRSPIALPNQPGFVRLSLPKTGPVLQEGVSYRWYFTLHCGPTQMGLDGGMERIASSGIASGQTATAWYDRVDQIAQALQANPRDLSVRDRWRQLLQQLNLSALENQPFSTVELTR
jgi:hypothetical protein